MSLELGSTQYRCVISCAFTFSMSSSFSSSCRITDGSVMTTAGGTSWVRWPVADQKGKSNLAVCQEFVCLSKQEESNMRTRKTVARFAALGARTTQPHSYFTTAHTSLP